MYMIDSFLRMEHMKGAVETAIQNWVDIDNVVYLLRCANMHGAILLKTYCIDYIMKHYASIEDVDWNDLSEELTREELEQMSLRTKLSSVKSATISNADENSSESEQLEQSGQEEDVNNM
jgi:hypothetical protein